MRATLKKLHRYVSLTLAAVWLIQSLTGILMVFHWELDDALVPGEHRLLDPSGLGAAVLRVQQQHPDATVKAFYATAGAPDRFDIHVEDALGHTDVVRVDGVGRELISRPLDYDYRRAGFIQAAIVLHQTLFAGDRGKIFLGFSALFLLSNIVMGLVLAWPRGGEWRRALRPSMHRSRTATLFSWHRAFGLWLAVPAFILVSAGMLLALSDPLEEWLGAGAPPPALAHIAAIPALSLSSALVAPGVALQTALARFPDATLASMRMPSAASPWYRVRVRQLQEAARVYGKTAVYVSAADGHVLATDDAFKVGPLQRFSDALYPTHTGEIAGMPGRLLTLAVGAWLLTMLVLGILLWSGRRPA